MLFRLLCPFSFEANFSLLGGLPVLVQEHGSLIYKPIQSDIFDVLDEPVAVNVAEAETPVVVTEDKVSATIGKAMNWRNRSLTVGSVIWLAGFVGLLIYSVVSLIKLGKKLEEAQHTQGNVYMTKVIDTPFVIGLIRTKIYFPATLAEKEKFYILLHEQIHIRRGDHIVKLVSFFALCLHWFNPLVWLAFFLIGKDMEMSCDEAVIRKIGNGMKKEYSASLLSLATGRRIVNGVPIAFGEGDTGSRIKNVLKYKKPAMAVVLIALVICVAVTVILMANPHKSSSDSDASDFILQTTIDELPQEVLYGIVKEVVYEGNVNKLITIPGMGEIEIPDGEVSIYFERESQELLPGDLVKITFAAGEEVSVLETWPGRFAQDAESLVVMWQGCKLEYEGEDRYLLTIPAGIVPDSEHMAVGDNLMIYREEEGKEKELWYKTAVLRAEESLDGIKTITVRISTYGLIPVLEGFGFHISFEKEKPKPVVLGQNVD